MCSQNLFINSKPEFCILCGQVEVLYCAIIDEFLICVCKLVLAIYVLDILTVEKYIT